MQEQTIPVDQDEITLKELAGKFKRLTIYLSARWKLIALITIVGIVLGVTYATFKKPVYTADCNFVLDIGDNKAGGGGAYSGVASLMGLDVSASSGLFEGDNIIELYKSRLMIEKTLLTPAVFAGKKDLLVNRYIKINNLRSAWAKTNPKIKNIDFSITPTQFTLAHDSVLAGIVGDINGSYLTIARPDVKLNIVKVSVKSKDQYFAKEFADKVVANVNSFYVQTKTQRSLDNINILRKQVDSLRRMLTSSMSNVASAGDANPNPNPSLQSLRLPSQRKQVDVQSTQSLYLEAVNNLELAKIGLRKERPIIQVIDGPIYPLPSTSVGKIKGGVIGGVLGLFLITLIMIVRKSLQGLLS
ncbi:lipopolysaccharide biosynthesis protein [Mucilaginibacter robiniae]|uniref:Lipopolysaccharide biosynthesis protein n=1 Tax=Mucilaginibacter robiniae TaxID=2728022 RepID=A0A7L5E3F4_9SPHI|nr:Wzz/FepE/Etk N-terminal domain-containing protein [Mucilaginibacter robiniae]QJD97551.1 lipopolysaccharide biosynthesis protein [Mucilaginibacter robiniae]